MDGLPHLQVPRPDPRGEELSPPGPTSSTGSWFAVAARLLQSPVESAGLPPSSAYLHTADRQGHAGAAWLRGGVATDSGWQAHTGLCVGADDVGERHGQRGPGQCPVRRCAGHVPSSCAPLDIMADCGSDYTQQLETGPFVPAGQEKHAGPTLSSQQWLRWSPGARHPERSPSTRRAPYCFT